MHIVRPAVLAGIALGVTVTASPVPAALVSPATPLTPGTQFDVASPKARSLHVSSGSPGESGQSLGDEHPKVLVRRMERPFGDWGHDAEYRYPSGPRRPRRQSTTGRGPSRYAADDGPRFDGYEEPDDGSSDNGVQPQHLISGIPGQENVQDAVNIAVNQGKAQAAAERSQREAEHQAEMEQLKRRLSKAKKAANYHRNRADYAEDDAEFHANRANYAEDGAAIHAKTAAKAQKAATYQKNRAEDAEDAAAYHASDAASARKAAAKAQRRLSNADAPPQRNSGINSGSYYPPQSRSSTFVQPGRESRPGRPISRSNSFSGSQPRRPSRSSSQSRRPYVEDPLYAPEHTEFVQSPTFVRPGEFSQQHANLPFRSRSGSQSQTRPRTSSMKEEADAAQRRRLSQRFDPPANQDGISPQAGYYSGAPAPAMPHAQPTVYWNDPRGPYIVTSNGQHRFVIVNNFGQIVG